MQIFSQRRIVRIDSRYLATKMLSSVCALPQCRALLSTAALPAWFSHRCLPAFAPSLRFNAAIGCTIKKAASQPTFRCGFQSDSVALRECEILVAEHHEEEYRLTSLTKVITNRNEDSDHIEGANQLDDDVLEDDFVDGPEDAAHNEETIIRLINLVKENPILYDMNYEPTLTKNMLKRQKIEVWNRLSTHDIFWRGDMTPIQAVWTDILEQFTRRLRNPDSVKREKPDEVLSDRIMSEMRWIEPFLNIIEPQRKTEVVNSNDNIDKDVFYNDMSQNISEDVMISGCRPVVSHSGAGYVVVQPSGIPRQRAQSNVQMPQVSAHQPPPQRTYTVHTGSSTQPVRRLVISSTQPIQYIPRVKEQPRSIQEGQVLQSIKKDENGTTNTGPMTMMVDTTTYYQNGNGQKMYRLFTVPPGTSNQTQNVVAQQSNRNIHYDDLPPEPLIEGSPTPEQQQPPRKKMRGSSMSSASSSHSMSQNRIDDNNTIVAGGVPIADDEIIDDGIRENTIVIDPDGHLHEESPLLSTSPDVMISGQSARSSQQTNDRIATTQSIPSTSATSIHQGIGDRRGIPGDEDISEVVVEGGSEDFQPHQTQYDADLAFQQLISQHLSRLNDDDKALMKFNMQRILLDARFGDGTAKQLMVEEDILESGQDVHDDVLEEDDSTTNPP
ncbi:unnamed protein product [Caenorhabditis bovis]|uniref:MADF domain-containing protein n=1 Tax=Caenorhabditis bovis TaxID=2654633 RepID=A0A8S1EJ69_9PELO|nr:unnamed protein product [Caenorhabditis bovis]